MSEEAKRVTITQRQERALLKLLDAAHEKAQSDLHEMLFREVADRKKAISDAYFEEHAASIDTLHEEYAEACRQFEATMIDLRERADADGLGMIKITYPAMRWESVFGTPELNRRLQSVTQHDAYNKARAALFEAHKQAERNILLAVVGEGGTLADLAQMPDVAQIVREAFEG